MFSRLQPFSSIFIHIQPFPCRFRKTTSHFIGYHVTDQNLINNSGKVSGGLFRLKSSGLRLPLHNHDSMHTFFKILDGRAVLTTFSLLECYHQKKLFQFYNDSARRLGLSTKRKTKIQKSNAVMKGIQIDIIQDAVSNCKLLANTKYRKVIQKFVEKRILQIFHFHRKRFSKLIKNDFHQNNNETGKSKIANKNPAAQVPTMDHRVVRFCYHDK